MMSVKVQLLKHPAQSEAWTLSVASLAECHKITLPSFFLADPSLIYFFFVITVCPVNNDL